MTSIQGKSPQPIYTFNDYINRNWASATGFAKTLEKLVVSGNAEACTPDKVEAGKPYAVIVLQKGISLGGVARPDRYVMSLIVPKTVERSDMQEYNPVKGAVATFPVTRITAENAYQINFSAPSKDNWPAGGVEDILMEVIAGLERGSERFVENTRKPRDFTSGVTASTRELVPEFGIVAYTGKMPESGQKTIVFAISNEFKPILEQSMVEPKPLTRPQAKENAYHYMSAHGPRGF